MKTGFELQTRSSTREFYIVKVRPCLEEIEKDEAYKKHHLLSTTAQSINKEIEELKAEEEEINRKLKPIYRLEKSIEYKRGSHYYSFSGEEKKTMPRKAGVIYLAEKIDAKKPIRPDKKRCQKRLINKGQMDMEFLQKVEEELLDSKKKHGMTSCGTQELDDLINSMAQRIQHGSKNRKEEMKIHDKLRELKITKDMYTEPEPEPKAWRRSEYWEKKYEEGQRRREKYLKLILKYKDLDLEILRKNRMKYETKVMRFETKLQFVKKDIISLQKKLENVNSEKDITYNLIQTLYKQLQEETCFDDYRSLLTNVNKAARTGDVKKVELLCDTQVEGFMAQWSDNQAFRDEYQRRKLIDATLK